LAGFFADFVGDFFKLMPSDPMRLQAPGNRPPFGNEMPPMRNELPMGPNQPGPQPFHRMIIDNALVSILVVGFNAAIKVTVIWQAEEQKNKELEKEKLQTELAFLKNQVSPHFFMNTLNNIHALIDINTEDAKESLIKLSKLMRYLLYDSETGKTTLAKEIEFIKSYVDLMKLRFTEKVSVNLAFPENVPNIEIPPMLFTSLLENAFKHGVSYQSDSFIEIIMNANKEFLFFRIINSKQKSRNGIVEKGGIGLDNLQKRLDLIYGKDYSLVQNESEKEFEINIKLPLNEA
jgi:LytS/YehU family sensor histidine kinase